MRGMVDELHVSGRNPGLLDAPDAISCSGACNTSQDAQDTEDAENLSLASGRNTH